MGEAHRLGRGVERLARDSPPTASVAGAPAGAKPGHSGSAADLALLPGAAGVVRPADHSRPAHVAVVTGVATRSTSGSCITDGDNGAVGDDLKVSTRWVVPAVVPL